MTDAAIKDPYIVKEHDTLSAIAKACGKSTKELRQLNKLNNPNRLDIGQTLYLSRETAFGVSVLFLDALRHPIENLFYKIKFDGQTKAGKTPANGLAPRLITKDASSRVEIFVQDLQGQWINVCNVISDYGHKLTTLVSGAVVFKGATEKHPQGAPAKPEPDRKSKGPSAASRDSQVQPAPPKPASGGPTKNNPAVKKKKTKGKQGQAIIEIGVDIPDGLQKLFNLYNGEAISTEQWKETAKGLECEVEVIKAIAEVETKGAAFWRLNKDDGAQIPSILFERHWFQRLTKHAFDNAHPDISGPAYTNKNAAVTDRYGSYSTSYLRLINAYRLDPSAALCSCSWGKFQIMGGEYKTCGIDSVGTLVKSMCTSESEQIGLLASFIRRKAGGKLWKAVKAKDWTNIALYYNGKDYKKDGYDTKLQTAYEKHKFTQA